jgi:isopentenyldiphosphate isomerase
MKTLPHEGFTYSSSGVEAEYYTPKFKSPYTDVVLNRHPLLKPHMSTERQQSTKELLAKPDVVVCLDKSGIDAGETPIQAARRETHEELGVDLHEKHFEPLFTYKLHSYHPHYKKRTKGYVYVYSARLPVHSTHLRPQPGEVEELRVLTPREVKRALRTHRVKHFGPLQWTYKLYDKAIAYSDQSV